MNERCSSCNLKYQMEPSFFYGAMYTSYGIGVAVGVAIFVLTYAIIGFRPFYAFIAITIGLFLLYPIIARLGRSVWINLFVNYDAKALENHQSNKNIDTNKSK
ncbi:DUF983 domain-containing protein [Aquimarina sp. U1-2]|uniref:DUF983 domain-containing protein n=1 Tax=Aquimarina sp. U1-2 TaxID=2823141 RepID=UPI0035305362